MPIALYLDVHIDRAIADQLRLRQIDVLTAQDDQCNQQPDEYLLERATMLGRPIVTHDIRFLASAQQRQIIGRPFCGLIYGHPMRVTIGKLVTDLEIIAKATDPSDWSSTVIRLPL